MIPVEQVVKDPRLDPNSQMYKVSYAISHELRHMRPVAEKISKMDRIRREISEAYRLRAIELANLSQTSWAA